jgi:NifU-like protein involved in Fe-S cluster formation
MTLYSPQILALAAGLADYPLSGDFAHRASARSRTCGSVIELGLACDAAGRVSGLGIRLAACAMGQASAAIMAAGLVGRTPDEVTAAHHALRDWLAGAGAGCSSLPDWPQIGLLAPALPHKGRHGVLILPWTAALEALCSAEARR